MSSLIFLVLVAGLFYVALIVPQRRKARAQQQMSSALKVGVEVVTIAGKYATVTEVTDDEVYLEVAPGVIERYVKGAIARVVPPPEPEDAEDTEEAGEDPADSDEDPAAPRES